MKKYITLTLSFVAGILLSCENEIPYNLEEKAPKLIMNAMINADSLQNLLFLNYTGKSEATHVQDATVEVTVNGQFKESAQAIEYGYPGNKQKVFLITTPLREGDIVRIDARTSDGKHHAWIQEKVPHHIEVQSIDTATIGEDAYYSSQTLRIKAHIKDRPGEKNYYRISIETREEIKGITEEGKDTIVNNCRYTFWPWEDFVLTDGKPATKEELELEVIDRIQNIYGIFSDDWFADSEYTMTVQSNVYSSYYTNQFKMRGLNIYVKVSLLSITENEYHYLNVLNYYDSSSRNEYLNDPVKIPSNVHGGVGFVGLNTEVSQVFHVVKDKNIAGYEED